MNPIMLPLEISNVLSKALSSVSKQKGGSANLGVLNLTSYGEKVTFVVRFDHIRKVNIPEVLLEALEQIKSNDRLNNVVRDIEVKVESVEDNGDLMLSVLYKYNYNV